MSTATLSIKQQYEALKAENPRKRIRDIAAMMELSEAQLVAAHVGITTTKLEGDFKELLKEVHTLGYVMALTRNNNVVHERKGVYNNVSFEGGPVGLVLNEDIDLRLFMMHWATAFAVQEGDRNSLQFFDKSGEAVHKIYLNEKSNFHAFESLVAKYKAAVQSTELTVMPYPATPAGQPDEKVDVAAFSEEWKALQDTHDFFMLLKKYNLSRTQGLRLAPEGFAQLVPNNTARKMLDAAAASQTPIMVFVSSRGCIQIHTGTVKNLMETGPWYNVLDPEFNLHLMESNIADIWVVKKPSADGIVTSIEVFDANGEMIVQFFGKRKPGNPELEAWREIVKELITTA